jgi:uncharacterized protein involved in exopolysaccharide biosynthesis
VDFTPGLFLANRHWRIILLTAILAGAAAFAASFLVSPTYSASSRVLVRARETRFLTSTGQDLSARPGALEFIPPKSLSQTLSGLVTSRPVTEQVVRELRLDQRREDETLLSQVRSGFKRVSQMALAYLQHGYYAEPDPFEGAVVGVQRTLEATPIKDSYLIEIKAKANEAQLAAAIADAATRAFVQETRASFQQNASNYRQFLADETERATSQVRVAEETVRQYKQRNGISDLSEAVRLSTGSEESLRQQLREAEAEVDKLEARRAAAQETLARLSPTERTTTSVQGRALASTASTLETGRAVSTTGNDTSSETSETRETTEPNRVYQDVQRTLLATHTEIAGLQAKRDALNTQLTAAARTAAELAEHSARLNELELQRATAHASFTGIRAAYEGAIINDARGAEEVRPVEGAAVPIYPDRPLRYLFALLGLLCGLGGGAALVYVMDSYGQQWSTAFAPRRAAPSAPAAALGSTSPDADGFVPPAGALRPAPRFEI